MAVAQRQLVLGCFSLLRALPSRKRDFIPTDKASRGFNLLNNAEVPTPQRGFGPVTVRASAQSEVIRKRMGEMIHPWGTPDSTGDHDEGTIVMCKPSTAFWVLVCGRPSPSPA